jgi:predicted transcriptional regulator of viral defense system
MDAQWSQKALQNLQRFHQLKDEASIRYAQALIDREIAVLELADVMDQHECDVAERELQTVDAALAAAEQDLAEAEAEYLRAQAEGPALHRKRDVLDRVNKEAEHRERLQELQQHISACKERIVSERAFGAGAEERREQAVSDLTEVR